MEQYQRYPKFLGKLEEFPSGTSYDFYAWNEDAQGKVYGIEYVPSGFNKEGGEKLPMIICAHGMNGDEKTLDAVAKDFTKSGISAITFGCRGKSKKSDDGSASITSRASDLNAMLLYAQSLPWVDLDRIYFYGESYGGMTIMASAEYFQDDIAGIFIGASALNGGGSIDSEFPQYGIQEGQTWEERVLAYQGDFIMFHAKGDKTFSSEASRETYERYLSRNNGAVCEFHDYDGGEHDSLSDEGEADRLRVITNYISGE